MMLEHVGDDVMQDMTNEEILTTAVAIKNNLHQQASSAQNTREEVQKEGIAELEKIVWNKTVGRQRTIVNTGWGQRHPEPNQEMTPEQKTYGGYPSDERWLKKNPSLCRGCAKAHHYISSCHNPFLMESKTHRDRMKRLFCLWTIADIWMQGGVPPKEYRRLEPGETRIFCYRCSGEGHNANNCQAMRVTRNAGNIGRAKTERDKRDQREDRETLEKSQIEEARLAQEGPLVSRAQAMATATTRRVVPRARPNPDSTESFLDESDSTKIAGRESVMRTTGMESFTPTAQRVVLPRRAESPVTRRPRSPTPEQSRASELDGLRYWPSDQRSPEEEVIYNAEMQRRLHPSRRPFRESTSEEDVPERASVHQGATKHPKN
jgi:hypothetical protein